MDVSATKKLVSSFNEFCMNFILIRNFKEAWFMLGEESINQSLSSFLTSFFRLPHFEKCSFLAITIGVLKEFISIFCRSNIATSLQ